MKKRGLGVGKWNGFGGKVEPNETIEEGAKREVKEECGLDVDGMEKVGILEFEGVNSNEILEGHVFICTQYSGDIIETEEMAPKWFKIKDTPYDTMWADHKFWYPMLLKKIPFKAYFKYQGYETILDYNIKLLNSIEKPKTNWICIIFKKDCQILLNKNKQLWSYFSMAYDQVESNETLENAFKRCLNKFCGISDIQTKTQKVAVVDIELIDQKVITETNVFVVNINGLSDFAEIEGTQWLNISSIPKQCMWPDTKFLSTVLQMKPFRAYFLNDLDKVLFSKYYD
ncbi:uncharacterized protein LOC126840533 isoform X2 [Adelges cooleyi]|nr:uncharacterized protein LOC126840533 isoform X2 [Adelges cooleyi]